MMNVFNDTMKKIEINHPLNILFICSGNICQSVYADFQFRNMIEKSDNLADKISIKSGAVTYKNRRIDPRTKKILIEEGIHASSIDKHIPKHFSEYSSIFEEANLIIGMTDQHKYDLPLRFRSKFRMISELINDKEIDLEDPYWTNTYENFEKIMNNLKKSLIQLKNQFELYFT